VDFGLVLRTPDSVQEQAMGQDSTGVEGELFEELIFDPCETLVSS
jgi:hypothetical protein